MDVSIKCQLSLSKKLRALIKEGETRITLIANSITDGKGDANLIISSNKPINKNTLDFLGKETSIILVPMEMSDVTIDTNMVGAIFSKNIPQKTSKVSRSPIDKIATYEEPEEGEEAFSIKTKEEIEEEIPEPLKITKDANFKRYIDTLDKLEEAVKEASKKVCNIDPDAYEDKRKRAEAIELREKAESIDTDAYIVNDKCATLSINDLGINLILNMPYNLANISAKRIMGSRDLKAMFKANLVKFIKPNDISKYVNLAERSVEKPTLDVYSSPEEAEEQMERAGMNVEKIDIGGEDLFRPTESQTLLTNLTSRPRPSNIGGVVKTTHGNTMSGTTRNISQDQQVNSKGLKTIKRTGLNY